jgi:hypothetical protein
MAEKRTYVCDVCGAMKGEANHWWLAKTFRGGGTLPPAVSFYPWTAEARATLATGGVEGTLVELCGAKCLHSYLATFEAAHGAPRGSAEGPGRSCGLCGRVGSPAEPWWLGKLFPGEGRLPGALSLFRWTELAFDRLESGQISLCCEPCVLKLVKKWAREEIKA